MNKSIADLEIGDKVKYRETDIYVGTILSKVIPAYAKYAVIGWKNFPKQYSLRMNKISDYSDRLLQNYNFSRKDLIEYEYLSFPEYNKIVFAMNTKIDYSNYPFPFVSAKELETGNIYLDNSCPGEYIEIIGEIEEYEIGDEPALKFKAKCYSKRNSKLIDVKISPNDHFFLLRKIGK